jgi:Leucine-rich repeat (LRR) protein
MQRLTIIFVFICYAHCANGRSYRLCKPDGVLNCFTYFRESTSSEGSKESSPCYSCNRQTIECLESNNQTAELVKSIDGCLTENQDQYVLTMKSNNYPVLRNHSLANQSIVMLELVNTLIDKIEPAAFDSIIGLKSLNILKNNLTSIDFGSTEKRTLQSLNLGYNAIRRIDRNSFSSLTGLIYLDLDSNLIDFIDENAFEQNTQLIWLNLKSNLLKAVDFKSQSLQSLSLVQNKFTEIKTGRSFKGFDSLLGIKFDDNNISRIECNAFDGAANTLQGISLNQNSLVQIDACVFSNTTFKSLTALSFHSNAIEDITPEFFTNLVGLKNLFLGYNKIRSFGNNKFIHMNSVQELDMSNMRLLDKIEGGRCVFAGLESLRKLTIRNNSIESIGDYAFSALNNLEYLSLESNLIKKITENMLSGLVKLTNLELPTNLIESLEKNVFKDLKTLKFLILEHNRILKIEPEAFIGIADSLVYLRLSRNRIQFVKKYHFNSLTKLESLDLAVNQISSIETGSFDNLTKLVSLVLKENSIFHLDPALFKNMISLDSLDLSSNMINTLYPSSFQHLNKLDFLNLEANVITILSPGLFSYLTNLRALSLAGNPIIEIDLSCFDNSTRLGSLDLSSVNPRIKIKSSTNSSILPSLNSLEIENLPIRLVRQFVLSKLEFIKLDGSELDSSVLKKIPTNRIRRLSIFNVKFNGFIDDFLGRFSETLNELRISGCSIRHHFNLGLLAKSTVLQKLTLSNCTGCFDKLDLKNFANYTQLTDLNLAHNGIAGVLNNELLKNMEIIESINMSNNALTGIHKYAFWPQTKLKKLDLSHNMITTISSCSLENLVSLEHLDLSFNKLIFLRKDAFCTNTLANLKYLELRFNHGLKAVSIFSYTTLINHVSIRTASLNGTFADMFSVYPFIWHLDLSDNKFESINTKHFESICLIQVLEFSHNLISKIEEKSFVNMKMLLDLSLDCNKLTVIQKYTFFGLTQLKSLNLSSNQITIIESEAFMSLRRLEQLNLNRNLIRTLANGLFSKARFVRTIRLETNPLESLFTVEILEGLESLKFLYLSGSGNQIQFTDQICSTIIKTLNASFVKKVLDEEMYDGVSIYAFSSQPGRAYLEQTDILKPCMCIVHLLRKNIQLNMMFDKDVIVYLNECSLTIRTFYLASIKS